MRQNVVLFVKILGINDNVFLYGLELFGTGHGKGQWDGVITHVKSALCSEQMKIVGATKLQNALDVCNFLQTSMGEAIQQQVKQYFHEIRLGDFDCTHGYEAHIVSGSRSKHVICSISNLNKSLLYVQELSCFYEFCIDGGDGHVKTIPLYNLGT